MKKRLLIFIMALLVMLPTVTKAAEYTSMNLQETLEAESIEADLSSYSETDDQITIYMFRGNGCTHCQHFLSFLSSIVSEYGKYFKLRSYETWYDSNNSELFSTVAEALKGDGEAAQGVPFIVIGDKTFIGYSDSYAEDIKEAIVNLYNSSSRYDVLVELGIIEGTSTGSTTTEDDTNPNVENGNVARWVFVGAIFVAVGISYYVSKDKKPSHKSEEETKVVIKEIKEEVEDEEEVKPVVKKTNNTKSNTKPSNKSTNNKNNSKTTTKKTTNNKSNSKNKNSKKH